MTETTQDRSANVYLGMALEINNRAVELAPTTPINKIDEMGLELELPDNLYLGKLKDGIDALVKQFSPNFKFDDCKEKAKDIPALQNIIAKVGDAEITIQDLHIKIPPKPKPVEGATPVEPANLYTVALAANWPKAVGEPESLGGFNITLRGLYVMVTNETREEIDLRRARAKALQKKAESVMALEAAYSSSPDPVNNDAAGETTTSAAAQEEKPTNTKKKGEAASTEAKG